MARKMTTEPQIRFNWGYHDGAADAERNRTAEWAGKPHFDPTYEAGYHAGHADQAAGTYTGWSASAWQRHCQI